MPLFPYMFYKKYFRKIIQFFFCLDKCIFSQAYQREIIAHVRTTVELRRAQYVHDDKIPSNTPELPKIAECAARLSHVQTRVINSGTHLRIHTAELWGLQNNEILWANYTRGERASLLAAELARQSHADFRQR